jgi:hypothetical protein
MSAAVGAAILNKEIRQSVMSSLTKAANGSKRPDQTQTIIEGALAYILLRSMKGSWIAQPASISAIAALLVSLMKSNAEKKEPSNHDAQVIDIDDYTVID